MKTNASLVGRIAAASLFACAAVASATTFTFSTSLTGAGESPPVTTTAFGSATVSFNDVLNQVAVQTSWTGLTGGASTAGHIHCCTASPFTGTAPVVLPFSGLPSLVTGTYSNAFTLAASDFSTLLAGTLAGKSYVNIHNAVYPNGEIQGYLVQVGPVPEPATTSLLLLGGLATAWGVRRRRGGVR